MAAKRANWFAGFIAALMMTITLGLIWNDWALGAGIGVTLGIVAAFVFRREVE